MSLSAAEAESPTSAVLNKALLDQYRARKSNLLERLIAAYLDEAPRYFQNIRRAAEDVDLPQVRQQAHALKSCAGNLGATRLAKVCQELENAAIAGRQADVAATMLRIGPETFEAEQALRAELSSLRQISPAAPKATEIDVFDEEWN